MAVAPAVDHDRRMHSASTSAPITGIDQALAELGATPDLLSDADRQSLDERGYVFWPDAIAPDLLDELRVTYDAVLAREGATAGHDYQQEAGAIRLGNLIDKGACFLRLATHARYLAAVRHVIGGPFALDSLSAREPIPGWDGPDQGFHTDGIGAVVDAVVMLDDFTRANGAPRLIPSSHRWDPADRALDGRTGPHPDEMVLEGPAGGLIAFNGMVWHSGRRNRTGGRRRGLFPFMNARREAAGAYQRAHLSPTTIAGLAPAERYLLALD